MKRLCTVALLLVAGCHTQTRPRSALMDAADSLHAIDVSVALAYAHRAAFALDASTDIEAARLSVAPLARVRSALVRAAEALAVLRSASESGAGIGHGARCALDALTEAETAMHEAGLDVPMDVERALQTLSATAFGDCPREPRR